MTIKGEMLIGGKALKGTGAAIYGYNPASGEKIQPAFASSSKADVEAACRLAHDAFDSYRNISLEQRAVFLETIADEILALGDSLVERVMAESGLPEGRVIGERGRTMGQFKLFAKVVREGDWAGARIDAALPERQPMPRADLRMRHIPLGPVAVFGASNFPLAYSVAGGDTASALAAGCPVIVKAHPAHPGTSELIGKAIMSAVKKCGMPDGVFSLIFDSGYELGIDLVANPHIKAVGFTGSRSGGLALMDVAAKRPEPIPVYAEMSSINPVFLLPNALKARADTLASGFVNSLALGSGQFCTNPGLVIGLAGDDLNRFIETASAALSGVPTQTMLTANIHKAYIKGVEDLSANDAVSDIAKGQSSSQPNQCQAQLYKTTAQDFLADARLSAEVFGSSSLVVECSSVEDFFMIAENLEGQLTATLQLDDPDMNLAKRLLPILERKAGRILCNGFPTGVEVCGAMVHGGPFPASSDSRTTSVGNVAILRFLRPVCYQDVPAALLPAEVDDENTLSINRIHSGA